MKTIFSIKNRYVLFGAALIGATIMALILNCQEGQSRAMMRQAKISGVRDTKINLPLAVLVKDNESEWRGSSEHSQIHNILKDLEVPLYAEDLVSAFPDPKLKIGTTISIKRAPIIYLRDGLKFEETRSWRKSLADYLNERQISLGPLDQISPSLNSQIKNKDRVIIVRIGERDESIDEIINFQKIERRTTDLYKGQREIEQRGADGKKTKTFRLRYENNVLVSRVLIKEEIIINPRSEIIIVGIRPRITVRCRFNSIVEEASAKYGVDANSLCRTMMCESNGNPNSYNPSGPYYGLYQYTLGLWNLLSPKAGYAGADIFNPTAQIFTIAWAWSHGYRGRWPNC